MAKGRKRVSLSSDAFSAINSVGKTNKGGKSQSKADKETRKFELIAGLMHDLRTGTHKGSDGKQREIRSDNKGAIAQRVVRLLAEGVTAKQILFDSGVLATVRAERFGLSPVGENPDMGMICTIRDIVLGDLPEGVNPSDVCAVFNWPEPENQETAETPAEPTESPEETAEMVTADKPPVHRRKGNKGKQEKAPVAAE